MFATFRLRAATLKEVGPKKLSDAAYARLGGIAECEVHRPDTANSDDCRFGMPVNNLAGLVATTPATDRAAVLKAAVAFQGEFRAGGQMGS